MLEDELWEHIRLGFLVLGDGGESFELPDCVAATLSQGFEK